jgi:CheY-like chemotaxis protein
MKKILLIDDDELVIYALKRYLEKNGFHVISLNSGKSVLEKIKETNPNIVITDIIMPDVEGMEVITKIRNINKQLPIIAISGGSRYVDKTFLTTAEMLGASASLEKPLDEEKLLELINNLI